MLLIADTHVHFYPCYDLARAASLALSNLKKRAAELKLPQGPAVFGLCLAERRDCHFFAQLSQRAGGQLGEFRITAAEEPGVLNLHTAGGETLVIISGRQIITRERLEVLALGEDLAIEDGLPIGQVLALVRKSTAVVVLPWSPGKWMFSRGRLIAELIKTPGFALGDTLLRGRLMPRLMSLGQNLERKIIAGSDPLPFRGEEQRLGEYATAVYIEGECSAKDALRRMVLDAGVPVELVGRRCSTFMGVRRWCTNELVRRLGAGRDNTPHPFTS